MCYNFAKNCGLIILRFSSIRKLIGSNWLELSGRTMGIETQDPSINPFSTDAKGT